VGEQFRDYWSAKAGSGSTKLDWQATWRNWVRNQKMLFKHTDLARTTVPSSSQRDPALAKLDEDYKNAKPNPEILAKIKEAFKTKLPYPHDPHPSQ
jgi:anti-sigma-K factor RskA